EQGIRQLLASFRWSTISSLVLFGKNIDQWMRLWLASGNLQSVNDLWPGPRLLRLELMGSLEVPPQKLSHPSALFIHRAVHSSPLADLCLNNVELQETVDWGFIV